MNKISLTLLLSTLCLLPAAAQNQATPRQKANPALGVQVERAVIQATATQPQQKCNCKASEYVDNEPLTTQELIEAEEELMTIRNQDIHATFEKYPYLLDPAYRRKNTCTCPKAQTQSPTVADEEDEELSIRELIEAEEELSLLRNRQDPNATFEKYPYLLQPQYRRATPNAQQSMRRKYTQSTWARKVGL